MLGVCSQCCRKERDVGEGTRVLTGSTAGREGGSRLAFWQFRPTRRRGAEREGRTERMDASASAASAVRSLSNTSVTRPSVTIPWSLAVFIRMGMMLQEDVRACQPRRGRDVSVRRADLREAAHIRWQGGCTHMDADSRTESSKKNDRFLSDRLSVSSMYGLNRPPRTVGTDSGTSGQRSRSCAAERLAGSTHSRCR